MELTLEILRLELLLFKLLLVHSSDSPRSTPQQAQLGDKLQSKSDRNLLGGNECIYFEDSSDLDRFGGG